MVEPRIAPAARDDLRDIRQYSKSAFGPVIARTYLDGLREVLVKVGTTPALGRIESDLGDAVRSIGYRSHRIYYRADATGVLVIRVLHQARDVAGAVREP